MRLRTLGTLAVGLLLASGRAASADEPCVNYEPDPRAEAQYANPTLTQADVLVTRKSHLSEPQDNGTVLMPVGPWNVFHNFNQPACTDRDYHGQATSGDLGSGVLVGPNLVLTAGHLFLSDGCPQLAFVFGFGNFTPNQWQTPNEALSWTVALPTQNVYYCQSVVYSFTEDWAVVTLDRNVTGRTPLPILRTPPFPPASTPVTIVGHPNRIPMKVEQVNVTSACPYCVDAHVLHGNSGSMVVDDTTGKVIGIAVRFHDGNVLRPQCGVTPTCYREWFSMPTAGAELTPAWLAAGSIP